MSPNLGSNLLPTIHKIFEQFSLSIKIQGSREVQRQSPALGGMVINILPLELPDIENMLADTLKDSDSEKNFNIDEEFLWLFKFVFYVSPFFEEFLMALSASSCLP